MKQLRLLKNDWLLFYCILDLIPARRKRNNHRIALICYFFARRAPFHEGRPNCRFLLLLLLFA